MEIIIFCLGIIALSVLMVAVAIPTNEKEENNNDR